MSEERQVLFVGVEKPTDNGFMLVAEFTEHSGGVIRRRGVRRFLEEARKEILQVIMINFEHVNAKLAKVTLRGEKTQGDRQAQVAFGREVVDKLDAIVTRILG